ncbi:hypothetical protein [uncultured Dokdonia sp.]|uniref:hypothetical protein n=1 Tax=uncultured Dokdonia sp. TaxID=575653 RepID=UPI0026205B2E|nr:hypothetical protein [uncultured Dokdonia sp.]
MSDIKQKAYVLHSIDSNKDSFCDFILVDGVPHDISNIDSVLSRYNQKSIEYIQFIKNTFSHKPCENITVIRTEKQSEKEKKKELLEIKNLLNNKVSNIAVRPRICNSCPLITINDKPIYDPHEQKKIINEIDINTIQSIYYLPRALRKDLWGSLGVNGIVQIKLNKLIVKLPQRH